MPSTAAITRKITRRPIVVAGAAIVVRLARFTLYGFIYGVAAFLLVAFVPFFFGYHAVPIYGPSMGSALPRGSLAFSRNVDASQLRVGDVITTRRGASPPVTHRIVALNESAGLRVATLKGDSNVGPDPKPIVLAGRGSRVEFELPWLAYGIAAAQSRLGRALLLLIPAGVWALAGLYGFVRLAGSTPAGGFDARLLPRAVMVAMTRELAGLRRLLRVGGLLDRD
jgi:signal peptidase